MSRVAAVLLVILGGAALWWADSGAAGSASANDAMVATMAAARERAAANDSRLKGALRFEQGGWIYVHLEGPPGAVHLHLRDLDLIRPRKRFELVEGSLDGRHRRGA